MARVHRAEVFVPSEIAIVHVMNRVVRRCFLMGTDELTGKCYDHRKEWIEELLRHFAGCFAIDLLTFSILSNHFHLVLRNRPDVVAGWSDREVARRWLLLCPKRKNQDGSAAEPREPELDQICNDPERLAELRRRLSDISWWMRLLCQRIAVRANLDDGEVGKFWQSRFRAVRLLDESAILACSVYVDLNPIRAAMAETLEDSEYTSVQRRIQSLADPESRADDFLAPLSIDERSGVIGPRPSSNPARCSDKGFLPISIDDYLELLTWTIAGCGEDVASQTSGDSATGADPPTSLALFALDGASWLDLANNFGRMFYHVAGMPHTIDHTRTRQTDRPFRMRRQTREALAKSA